ncbi:sensor histidine kinase [Deinococcus hohokamensis]|uniref:histidine kinase n=1 Tax=Deinococcus hohokamensis TaxID=309883 RepID=A0ABV9I5A5_9DEIO
MTALRRRAEDRAGEQPNAGPQPRLPEGQALIDELRQQQHELHVHQIELQLQMEQLIEANTELQLARAEYSDLFDFAPIGYLTLDRSGQILRANLTAGQQLGLPREALLRKRLSFFVDPSQTSSLTLFLRRVFETRVRRTLELRLNGPDGRPFYAQIEAVAADDERTQATVCRAAIIDITPQREAQDEVLRLNATLEERVEQRTAHIGQLNEELEALMYSVTHDLQMPLRHIRAFTGRLTAGDPVGQDEQARYAQHVLNSADRMEQLLGALMTYFRLSRQRVKFMPVDLNRVLRETSRGLQADLESGPIKLTSEPLPTVTGDIGAMKLVFAQLLSNAVKFSRGREAATIHVCAQETPREYIVCVQDNGVGFNMRQKGRLFGMFQRLHSERDFEGTGVGLALVRRIVLRHGGRVWAEGKQDQGATFWFSLPKRPPMLDDAPDRRSAEGHGATSPR